MGGSFTQKGHGGDKASNYIQDAQAVEGMRFNTAEQAHVGLLADGCGKMAEFLAQAPWDERRVGLGTTHLGIEQHLRYSTTQQDARLARRVSSARDLYTGIRLGDQ
jgi:hypothetical protein